MDASFNNENEAWEYENEAWEYENEAWEYNLDGGPITGKDVELLIESDVFKKLDDNDVVSICCVGIVQLVLLGVEDRRVVPKWVLRLANDRVGWDKYLGDSYVYWPEIVEEFIGMQMICLVRSRNRRRGYQEMKENNNNMYEKITRFMEDTRRVPEANTTPIIPDQQFGASGISGFQSYQGLPSAFHTLANNRPFINMAAPFKLAKHQISQLVVSSNWQTPNPSYLGTPNSQPPIPSPHGTSNLQNPMTSYYSPNLPPPILSHSQDAGILDPIRENRFALVRFIKRYSDRHCVEPSTLWIGRMHLHVNVVRYDRPPISSSRPNVAPRPTVKSVSRPSANGASSFVSVLKGNPNTINHISTSPAMVLDDECLVERDLDNFMLGEVKDFSSINNLLILLSNEGFQHVRLMYLGGLWVMIELPSIETKTRFMKHVGVASWFSQLRTAQSDFVSRERIVWIDIEGVPLHAWSRPTFSKIGSRWGEVLELEDNKDDCFARKRICIKTKQEDNILEKFKIIVRGKIFVVRAKELFVWSPSFKGVNDAEFVSDDDSVNEEEEKNDDMSKKVNLEDESDIEAWIKLLGFTMEGIKKDMDKIMRSQELRWFQMNCLSLNVQGLGSKAKKDWIKELNNKHKVNFLSIQETKSDHISDMDIKSLWGNSKFDCTISESVLDQGGTNESILQYGYRSEKHHDINSANARDYMQKAKIQWAIEGDENSKFFHGIINRKRANLAIKGVMVDGDWVDDPCRVKEEFRLHFANRFRAPVDTRYKLNYTFPNKLQPDQMATLKSPISRDEVRNAVWGCGENKSPGPDGFSFEFFSQILGYRIGSDFYEAVEWQILDGPFIINELISWCKHKKQQAMVFKVDFAKAYDSIRLDFLEDVLIGFGPKWCSWIRGCLHSGMASLLLNDMDSLHLLVSKAIEAGCLRHQN
ncbi:RNA-directed DNA polymerase, eukaryota [Tanacetum coccineum]